jgi:cytochrome c-type biogenesis protein CcmF
MIPELGHFALILAALVSLILGTLPMIGAHANRRAVAVARPAPAALAMLVAFSFACLTQAFVATTSRWSVRCPLQFAAPIEYRVAGVWGGHEARCCCGS